MKKILVLLFLFSTSSSFANQYILTCISDKDFLTVYKVDEVQKEITHLSSKSLDSEFELNNINKKLNVVSWKNNYVVSIDVSEPKKKMSFISWDLLNYHYIITGMYFARNAYSENGYTFSQYFECIKG